MSTKKQEFDSRVYTVPEAGRVLGLSRQSAYKAVRSGKIPAIRIGAQIRVTKQAIERLLNETAA